MSVINTIEDVGPWKKRLELEVPAAAVDAEIDRVAKDLGRKVKVSGFRPGKVPASVIKSRFRDALRDEVLERLVPRYWHQAQSESQLEPMMSPQIEDVELEEGSPLVFHAVVEVRPEVELGDLESFELPDPSTEPAELDMEEAIEKLQMQAADWVETDRPAARGDLVEAAVQEMQDGAPGGEAQEIAVEVGHEQVWEELSLALTGLSTGQDTTFERQETTEAGARQREFEVTVKSVKERDLPPLDDDFAAKVGKFESIDQLRERLRDDLRRNKEADRRVTRERALLEQLRERHPLELPRGVVEEELRGLLGEYAQQLQQQGVDVENADIDWQRLGDDVRPQAERRVHVRILLEEVAKARNVEVPPEALEERLAALARANHTSVVALRRQLSQQGRLEALRGQMRRERTIAALMGEEPPAVVLGDHHDHDHHDHDHHDHDHHDHDHHDHDHHDHGGHEHDHAHAGGETTPEANDPEEG